MDSHRMSLNTYKIVLLSANCNLFYTKLILLKLFITLWDVLLVQKSCLYIYFFFVLKQSFAYNLLIQNIKLLISEKQNPFKPAPVYFPFLALLHLNQLIVFMYVCPFVCNNCLFVYTTISCIISMCLVFYVCMYVYLLNTCFTYCFSIFCILIGIKNDCKMQRRWVSFDVVVFLRFAILNNINNMLTTDKWISTFCIFVLPWQQP